ncbi:MAG: tetratricopeptide repeat protein [Proteobacteria bacterium]|nr:tetratricopeptide repeat protein [Pseudomonadota bacterium]
MGREQLANLSIQAFGELDRALSLGESAQTEDLEKLIRSQLSDTVWRVTRKAKAAAPDALFAAALMRARGILVERDAAQACKGFLEAAAAGHLASHHHAALCLLQSDPARATTLLRHAADDGHPAAQEALGRACLEARANPDLECAAKNIGAAAAAGRPSAKSLLGWMHQHGTGVPRDPGRAYALYLEAAGRGDLAAQNNLGELSETGAAGRQDDREAAAWYERAAASGFAPAQFNLGRLLAEGRGVPEDIARARMWLEKARSGGVTQAQALIEWIDGRRMPSPRPVAPAGAPVSGGR